MRPKNRAFAFAFASAGLFVIVSATIASPALGHDVVGRDDVTLDLFKTDVTGAGVERADVDALRAGLEGQLEGIRGCYAKKVAKIPEEGRGGVVLAYVAVDAKGKVTAAQAGGPNDAIAACVTAGFKKAKIAKGPKRVAIAKLFVDVEIRSEAADAADPLKDENVLGGVVGGRGGVDGVDVFGEGGLGGVGGVGDAGDAGRAGRARPPDVEQGDATMKGEYDRNILRRYTRQKQNNVKFCYEQELAANSLPGPLLVTVDFVIASDGTVSQVKVSGDGPASMHACIEKVYKLLQFPKPTGGGVVIVKYPYVFKPSAP